MMAHNTLVPLHAQLLTEAEEIERRLGVTRLPQLLRKAAKALQPASAPGGGHACERACRQAVEMIDGANGTPSHDQLREIRRMLRAGIVVVEDASAIELSRQGQVACHRLVANG
jgi:hypothetical protein